MNTLHKALTKLPPLYSALVYLNTIRLTGTFSVKMLPQNQKADVILDYAKKYNCVNFVETGTYRGDTVNSCKDFFRELHSIELSPELFKISKSRFEGLNNIHIHHGNSGDLLPKICTNLVGPTLFWLDAHYSGGETARGPEDSPIVRELDYIFNRSNIESTILIDDARCFNGKAGYPRINILRKMIGDKNTKDGTNFELFVKNDIIRITNKI